MEKEILILAVESSCDETAAAVVRNGRDVRSNVISSQIELHKLYGGVVPEIASRKHIEKINQVIEEALAQAEVTLDDIDAIGVTYGPGLVGALLVGVAEAKAIAYAKGLPLVGVHHIEGHISANYIEHPELEPPFLCLVVSGGHTHLVCVRDYGKYEILGRTRTMRQEKPLTKWRGPLASVIRAVRKSTDFPGKGTRTPFFSHGPTSRTRPAISVSAA